MDTRFKTDYTSHNHKKRKRVDSQITITDAATHQTETLRPIKKLGAGSYGYVRLFQNAKGNFQAAVKAPHSKEIEFEKEEDAKQVVSGVKREFENYKTANSHHVPYGLHFIPHEKNNEVIVDYRMIIPFEPGMKLNECIKLCNSPNMLARLFLRTAQEFNRIHQQEVGIIHGDASSRNILVHFIHDDFKVALIDFGLSYPVNGIASSGFSVNPETTELAPERREDNPDLLADPSQDVYSLAKVFQSETSGRGVKNIEFFEKYPSIKNFIEQGLSEEPELRPSLTDFIAKLQREILLILIPKAYHQLINHLLAKRFTEAKQCLNDHQKDYSNLILNYLFYHLTKERLLDAAKFLLEHHSSIPIDRKVDQQTVFHLVAEWGDDYLDLLNQLFKYISARKLRFVLDSQDKNGQTLLSMAATKDKLGLLITILRYDQEIYRDTEIVKKVMATAQPLVIPVLNLVECISSTTQRLLLFRNKVSFQYVSAEREMKAAQYLLKHIMEQYPKISALKNVDHQFTIENSIKLSSLYDCLIGAKLLLPYPKDDFIIEVDDEIEPTSDTEVDMELEPQGCCSRLRR